LYALPRRLFEFIAEGLGASGRLRLFTSGEGMVNERDSSHPFRPLQDTFLGNLL
jgi:hypothetical protein